MSAFAVRAAAVVLGSIGLAGFTPSAQALTFVFNNVGNSLNAEQLSALQQAGNYWSSKLTDNVTVTIDVKFSHLGASVLGSTQSSEIAVDYSTVRSNLLADRKSALDNTATAHLQTGSALSFMATQGDGSSFLDNNGSLNNTKLLITTANAKAIGINVNLGQGNADASMEFSSDFNFSFNRSGAIGSNQIDFITVAEHEIGHALGFVSGVDFIDNCTIGPNFCGLSGLPNQFENQPNFSTLDLYRYSANGVLDLRMGGSAYFSVDGGATSLETFSTGVNHGNGWQASHFGPNVQNLMRPFTGFAQRYDATANDLAAMDAIGWDLAAAVPEPATWALWLGGLAAIGQIARRRRG